MPTNPTVDAWMSSTPAVYFQPKMSTAAARPAKSPEIAIARKKFFLTLMPPYLAASGLNPTARTS